MNTYQATLQKIHTFPLIPVFFHADLAIAQRVLQACYDGGVRIFEFTNRGPEALEVFEGLIHYANIHCPDLVIGIGTIFTPAEARLFIEKGAQFIVQPGTVKEVGVLCLEHQIPWIPGVLTPTEIIQALQWGAEIVKIFPGNVVGSTYLKSLRGPFPHAKFMVTGGVEPTPESIQEWFQAGANAVGLGSQLFKNIDQPLFIRQTLIELFNLTP
ncbi:MAG: bifunctional 4-hydroxy-2-oxoglutarate aldolase/2-dehydro-3-deoxy-phosphogluconate aldolase [Spirosomataceae bacterium]